MSDMNYLTYLKQYIKSMEIILEDGTEHIIEPPYWIKKRIDKPRKVMWL